METEFEWTGKSPEEVIERLQELQSQVESNLEAAAEEISLRIMADARRNAPVDTGRLRASIDQAVERVTEHTVRALVGSNVEYAPDQEVDQPYLRPAFEKNRTFIRDRIAEALQNAAEASA